MAVLSPTQLYAWLWRQGKVLPVRAGSTVVSG